MTEAAGSIALALPAALQRAKAAIGEDARGAPGIFDPS